MNKAEHSYTTFNTKETVTAASVLVVAGLITGGIAGLLVMIFHHKPIVFWIAAVLINAALVAHPWWHKRCQQAFIALGFGDLMLLLTHGICGCVYLTWRTRRSRSAVDIGCGV